MTASQVVSKWETEAAIPDLEVLLKISKLYDVTINDKLEPKIQPQRISDFEQISTIPETNSLCERMFPDIDFEMTRNNIGRIRI